MRYLIVAAALLVAACASPGRNYELPAWTEPGLAEEARPVQLQGAWSLNESLSDDPEPLIRRAVDTLRRNRRSVIIGDTGRAPTPAAPHIAVSEGPVMPGERDPYRDAAVGDPRLAALRAESVSIEQNGTEIRFTFNDAASVSYSIGQATSADQNINLSFADWEGSQFVVEKNGPDGLALERWILSPNGSQLYLAVSLEIKLPDFPLSEEPLLIGRMFERRR